MEKKLFILCVVQLFFAMGFLAHQNPEIHWCAIAPAITCVFCIVFGTKEEKY